MRIAVVGLGAVGTRAARQLASTPGVDGLVLCEPHATRREAVTEVLGSIATSLTWDCQGDLPDEVVGCDATVLAGPSETHVEHVRRLVALRRPVVSTSDSLTEVQTMLGLDDIAREADVPVVLGAAFSPGLSCVLARHGADWFQRVEEVHVARIGTGGPACAFQHHTSFGGRAMEWLDGEWVQKPSGSGRELCWFPDPVGAADCYRGALPEPLLIRDAFDGLERLSARLAGTRRDRMTARLPMLRPPHPEGSIGAIRVELRGWREGRSDTVLLGAMDRPAVAAGAVAALAATRAAEGTLRRAGTAGLAELVEPVEFLAELARRGVRAAVFEGTEAAAAPG